jgi:hypothetical protein
VYLWVPPPVVGNGGEFMTCSGQPIGAGAVRDTVLGACGPPTTTRQAVYATRNGEQVVDVWSYERPNAGAHTLRFENGVLTSIDSVGPLRR